MKRMKKLVSLLLAMIMVIAMTLTASAATINVDYVKKGETYTAYQLLHYTASDTDGDGYNDAFSYYLSKSEYDSGLGSILEAAGFAFALSSDSTQYTVTNAISLTADGIVTALNDDGVKTQLASKAISKKTATATADGTIAISSLDPGYYFIDSTMGSLCELKSYEDQAVILEKNTVPTVDKKQSLTVDGSYGDASLDLNMGDIVYYQAEISIGKGSDKEITLTDAMSVGLDLQPAISVTKAGIDVDTGDYALTPGTHGFTLILDDTYVKTLASTDIIVVKYSAKVNEKAVVNDADDNYNTAMLTYSAQTQSDTVYVATYDFTLKKTDGTNFLSGAKFRLYDAITGGNEIRLSKDATGYYKDATGTEEIDAGAGTGVNIRGLAPGTYYLEETAAPSGYNKLSARTAVTINTGATGAVEVTVVNNKGTELPSTGGIGTTIFYVLGAVLVLGAAVLLITKRRMNAEK